MSLIGRLKTWKGRLIVIAMAVLPVLYQNCGQFETATKNSATQASTTTPPPAAETYDPISLALVNPVPALTKLRAFNVPFTVNHDSKTSIKSVSCLLNGAAIPCSAGLVVLSAVADGDYVLRVNAEDSKGQKAVELSASFRVDGTVPVLNVAQTPAALTGSTAASFMFSAVDGLSGVKRLECAVDSAVYAACTSPASYTLAAGAHQIKIRATDMADNVSAEYTYSWTINTSAPTINITAAPGQYLRVKNASVSFSGTSGVGQAIADFECQLDGGGYAACTSPKAYTALAEGTHSFMVRGKDQFGIMSSPVAASFYVDTVVPAQPVLVSDTGASTSRNTASIQFSSMDPGGTAASGIASYQCSLDAGAYAACTSPRALTALAAGAHTFNVRALDNAGNQSAVGSVTWIVDTVMPTVTFSQTPASSTSATTASFMFAAADGAGGSGIQSVACQLDAAAYAACTTTASYSGLALGAHTFRVRAIDNAGNQAIQSYSWSIVAAAAAVNLAWDPNTEAALAGYKVYYGTAAGNYSNSVDAGKPATVAGAVNFTVPNLTSGRTYYFAVVAYDAARVESAYSNEVNKALP